MTLKVGENLQEAIVYAPRSNGVVVIPPIQKKEKGTWQPPG